MNILILASIYLGIGGLAVAVFIWGKPDGNSLFDRLYRMFSQHLPWLIKLALRKCCGKRAPAALDAAWNYVCYTSNPIVQIFYLCVITGGFSAFVLQGFPHIPNRLAGGWHKYSGFSVYCICIYVWWRACKSNPGIVTHDNVDALCKLYEWDDQIFVSMDCPTCKLTKPARSKHCSLCDVCISRFDHHCIWLNNCVGVGNHKWFLGFLFWHLVLCFYGLSMGSLIIWDLVVQKDLLNAVFVEPATKLRKKATYMIVFQYMLATEGVIIFITVLCGIMGILLCGFFLWHLNLVRMGTTTNELSKWHYIKWCLKQEGEEGRKKIKELRNIYNQGCFGNFREVFFPLDVDSLGPDAATNGSNAERKPAASKRRRDATAAAPDAEESSSKEGAAAAKGSGGGNSGGGGGRKGKNKAKKA